jgi:hypothetical protein
MSVTLRADFPAGTPLAAAIAVAAAWNAWGASAAGAHAWAHEALVWRAAAAPARLVAALRYGDCVDDEWVAAWLTTRLSGGAAAAALATAPAAAAADAAAVVQLEDAADGAFMLIDGADALPEWATSPDATRNRAFLFRGALHLVPPAALAGAPPPLAAAAALVRTAGGATLAPRGVAAPAEARIAHFPAALRALRHEARAALPPGAAWLFCAAPSIAAAAADAFITREPGESTAAAGLARVTSRALAAGLAPAAPLVAASVALARVQFAQLAAARLAAPERGGPYAAGSAAAAAHAAPALDVGLKLAVGLEVMLSRAPGPAVLRALSAALDAPGGGTGGVGGAAGDYAHVRAGARAAVIEDDGGELPRAPAPAHIIADIVLDRVAARGFYAVAWPPRADVDESRAWMSPDAAEREVDGYFARAAAAAGTAGAASEPAPPGAHAGARGLAATLQHFVERESGHEGAVVNEASGGSGSDGDGGMSDDDCSSDSASGSASDDAAPLPEAVLRRVLASATARTPLEPDVARALLAAAGGAGRRAAQRAARAAAHDAVRAMDAELLESAALGRHAALGGSAADEGFALHVAAGIEASVAAQEGEAGPASVLLGGLGVTIPSAWWSER